MGRTSKMSFWHRGPMLASSVMLTFMGSAAYCEEAATLKVRGSGIPGNRSTIRSPKMSRPSSEARGGRSDKSTSFLTLIPLLIRFM